MINSVLRVLSYPDKGSDANLIVRPVLEELRELVPDLLIIRVEPPVQVMIAGSNAIYCRERVYVDLQIVPGPLCLTNIEGLVLEAPEEELLLGRAALQSIGVDLN